MKVAARTREKRKGKKEGRKFAWVKNASSRRNPLLSSPLLLLLIDDGDEGEGVNRGAPANA